jgi:hypothetical protein
VHAPDEAQLQDTIAKVERLAAALEVADATCTVLPHSDSYFCCGEEGGRKEDGREKREEERGRRRGEGREKGEE